MERMQVTSAMAPRVGASRQADRVMDLLAARPWAQAVVSEADLRLRAVPAMRRVAATPVAPLVVPPFVSMGRAWSGKGLVAMLLGGFTTLLGCAAVDPPVWQVQPLLRAGASSSQVLKEGYTALARRNEYDGRWLQAADAWQKAVQADPSSATLHTALGVAMAQAGRAMEAVSALSQAVALSPGSAQERNNLGYALWLAGQPAEAAQQWRAALAINPAYRIAQANLALVEPADAVYPSAVHPSTHSAAASPVAPADKTPTALEVSTTPSLPALTVQTQPGSADEYAQLQAPALLAPPAAAPLRMAIFNGVGVVGAATKLRTLLSQQGLPLASMHNLLPYQHAVTTVQYRPGFADVAQRVADRLPGGASVSPTDAASAAADVRVILGHDRRTVLALCVAMNRCDSPHSAASTLSSHGGAMLARE